MVTAQIAKLLQLQLQLQSQLQPVPHRFSTSSGINQNLKVLLHFGNRGALSPSDVTTAKTIFLRRAMYRDVELRGGKRRC